MKAQGISLSALLHALAAGDRWLRQMMTVDVGYEFGMREEWASFYMMDGEGGGTGNSYPHYP